MTTFAKGQYVTVPKGTPLIARWYGTKEGTTTRDVVVEISDVNEPHSDCLLTDEEKEDRKKAIGELEKSYHDFFEEHAVRVHYPERIEPARHPFPARKIDAYSRKEIPDDKRKIVHDFHADIVDKKNEVSKQYVLLGESRRDEGTVLISWAKGSKTTFARNVKLAEKPEARKKQPKVNLRQQMVDKSRWKITKDVTITYGAPNPDYHEAMDTWNKNNPRPNPHDRNASMKWSNEFMAFRDQAQTDYGLTIPKDYVTLKAGTVFTVCGKFSTYFSPYGWNGDRIGSAAMVLVDGETKQIGLEYAQIKDVIEAESIPAVDAYVLRHKPTGAYYLSSTWPRKNLTVEGQEMVDTFMKGKKWDNLGKAKTAILMITGYYDGLPGADEALPEWSGGGKTIEITEDWELVHFDKLGRKELGVVEDFHDWFKHSWSLRELTMQFGSSVRTCYKALEKAKLLDEQKGMVIFTVMDQKKLDNVSYWGDRTAISDDDKTEIEEAIKTANLKKGKFKKAADAKSVAVSFTDASSALMFKLGYSGDLKVTVINLETLKEAVENNA